MELELQPNKQIKSNQINKICTIYIIFIYYCFIV